MHIYMLLLYFLSLASSFFKLWDNFMGLCVNCVCCFNYHLFLYKEKSISIICSKSLGGISSSTFSLIQYSCISPASHTRELIAINVRVKTQFSGGPCISKNFFPAASCLSFLLHSMFFSPQDLQWVLCILQITPKARRSPYHEMPCFGEALVPATAFAR